MNDKRTSEEHNSTLPPYFPPQKKFEERYLSGTPIKDLRQEFNLSRKQFEKVRDYYKLSRRKLRIPDTPKLRKRVRNGHHPIHPREFNACCSTKTAYVY